MSDQVSNEELFSAIITKAAMKQEVYRTALAGFIKMKEASQEMVNEYNRLNQNGGLKIPFEFTDRSPFEYEIRFGGDVLIFFMHTNIFEISRDHEVMRSSYIREDKIRSYCGIVHIFNFLSDSFKYNRVNDLGYLIGRIFINRDNHYFIEGKRELGSLYHNFSTSVFDKDSIVNILHSSIKYTLNFDLLTPPFDNMKEVTVMEMQNTIDSIGIRTAKRLGYRFNADKVAE